MKKIKSLFMTAVMVICMCGTFATSAHAKEALNWILVLQTDDGNYYSAAYDPASSGTKWYEGNAEYDGTEVADINTTIWGSGTTKSITVTFKNEEFIEVELNNASLNHIECKMRYKDAKIKVSGNCEVGHIKNSDEEDAWKNSSNYTCEECAIFNKFGGITFLTNSGEKNSLTLFSIDDTVHAKGDVNVNEDFHGRFAACSYGSCISTDEGDVTFGKNANVTATAYGEETAIKGCNEVGIYSDQFTISSMGEKAVEVTEEEGTIYIEDMSSVIASKIGKPTKAEDIEECTAENITLYKYLSRGDGYVVKDNVEDPVKDGTIENSDKELDTLFNITPAERALGVTVGLHVKEISGEVTQEEKALIEKAANGQAVAMYIDLYPWKQIAGGEKSLYMKLMGSF